MKIPLKNSLQNLNEQGVMRYKPLKAIIKNYSVSNKKATVQVLGSVGTTITNVPVSFPLQAGLKVGMTAILLFTEPNNITSAVVVAAY